MNASVRNLCAGLAVAALATTLTACGPAKASDSSSAGFKVGFSDPIAANTYMQAMSGATEAAVKAAGGTYLHRDAGLDPNQQVSDLEYFINQHVDAIIVPMPPVYDAIKPELAKAKAAGIDIIGMNIEMDYDTSATPPAPLDAQVVEDRGTAGQQQADYLATKLPQGGTVLYVGGPAPTPGITGIQDAFTKALATKSQFKLAKVVNNMTDDIAGAKPLVAAALAADPSIVAVVAYNDASAVGAAQAAKDAGRTLVIEGLQAMPEGISAIKDGTVSATEDVDVVSTGKLLGELAAKAAHDESDWKKTYVTAPKLLDADNVSSFVSWDDQIAAIK